MELRHKCRLLEDSQQPQHGSGKWTGVGATGSPASITNGGSTTDYGSLSPDDYRSLDVLRDEVNACTIILLSNHGCCCWPGSTFRGKSNNLFFWPLIRESTSGTLLRLTIRQLDSLWMHTDRRKKLLIQNIFVTSPDTGRIYVYLFYL